MKLFGPILILTIFVGSIDVSPTVFDIIPFNVKSHKNSSEQKQKSSAVRQHAIYNKNRRIFEITNWNKHKKEPNVQLKPDEVSNGKYAKSPEQTNFTYQIRKTFYTMMQEQLGFKK